MNLSEVSDRAAALAKKHNTSVVIGIDTWAHPDERTGRQEFRIHVIDKACINGFSTLEAAEVQLEHELQPPNLLLKAKILEAEAAKLRVLAAGTKTSYFTFGQSHAHALNGKTFDKDCVVKITAPDPRAVMVEAFGEKWGMEYDAEPDMSYYPRGVMTL